MDTRMVGSEASDKEGSETSSEDRGDSEYFGWVYHLGVNTIGHEYCHLRFLFLRGKYVQMYKRDPHENPDIKPIRKGVIGHTLMIEEQGRKKVTHGIACATAGEARKWLEAFEQAKQQVESEILRGSSQHIRNNKTELNLQGHRPRVRRYAHGLKRLIRIGKGPERLLRQSSDIGYDGRSTEYSEGDVADAVELHEWKCVRAINGIRILEDVASLKSGKGFLVKSVAVVDAALDSVFDVVLSLDKRQRSEWDMLTCDLELLDSVNGHSDVVYGTYNPKYLASVSSWNSRRDFIFSRQWFRGQDGSYTILQFPAVHKKRPPRSGYRRTKLNPSSWEIRRLGQPSNSSAEKCLVIQMMEIRYSWCGLWKDSRYAELEKTIPYVMLCQVAGLREFFGANPGATFDPPSTYVQSNFINHSRYTSNEFEDPEVKEEFYDALAADQSLEDEDSDDEVDFSKSGTLKLKNVSWAIASLALKRNTAAATAGELDTSVAPVSIDLSQFNGSLHKGKDDSDTNCWISPSGQGFNIRGKTYLKDNAKVIGGDPFLKLLAVDWLVTDNNIDRIALNPKCLVQSEAAKKLPFILVMNLQIPAKPNYSLVLYYGADRPINSGSLLGKFVDGSDTFRDARFKLIPSIVEGYWMVKRAVGSKACLLGKSVTCRYLRQDNFLEIDVDIGSSSVARSIISLVLGYVTSIVVDLAILIEGREESELPEYILGTVRLNRLRIDTAVRF